MEPNPHGRRDPMECLRPRYYLPPKTNIPSRQCGCSPEGEEVCDRDGVHRGRRADHRSGTGAGSSRRGVESPRGRQTKKAETSKDGKKKKSARGKSANKKKKGKEDKEGRDGKGSKKGDEKEENQEERTGYEGFVRKKELTSQDVAAPEKRKAETVSRRSRSRLAHPSERRLAYRNNRTQDPPSIDWDDWD